MALKDRLLLEKIWWAGVDRVRGHACVTTALEAKQFKPTHIAAVGKAASSMMRAALDKCGRDLPALCVTKYEHGESELAKYTNLKLIESAHPVPDQNSLLAGQELIEFVKTCGPKSNLLLLVSGGASALAESLDAGMSLEDLQALNKQMLAGGLDIHTINKKRKEISKIKDGKLLSYFQGQAALSLLISDVEGDTIGVIGSGIGGLPRVQGNTHMDVEVIASNAMARMACDEFANDLDIDVIVHSESLYGDVFEVASHHANIIKQGAPGLYIFGGEPTTILPAKPGEGGRNQALSLAMARELSGIENISILVAGTDGSDGPTGSAGGFVTGDDWEKFEGGEDALIRADSGAWLRKTGGLFVSEPTGTNVMDLMLVLKG